MAEELDFEATDVIVLLKKKNWYVHMCVGMVSKILRRSVSVVDTGDGSNLIRTSFIPLKWHGCICPIHDVSVQVIGKVMMFVQKGDLHVRLHFGAVHNLTVLLLVGTSLIARFVRDIFLMERCMVPIWSHPVAIIS